MRGVHVHRCDVPPDAIDVNGWLGRPARIPEDLRSAFELVPDEKAMLQALDAGALA